MLDLAIIPRRSIGPIVLGDSRENVRQILATAGFPVKTSRPTLDYFCEASIQISYVDETASFIGISFNASYACTYQGVNVFDVPAVELFELISASEGGDIRHAVDLDGYIFPNQLVTLWDADPQYDRLREETRPIWAQVGIGDDRYAAAVAKIKNR